MKAGILFLALTGLSIGCAVATPPAAKDEAEPLRSRLVGTWQVMEVVDTDPAGKIQHPYGERPTGYIVYDPTGHLHVQLMRTPATPPFAEGDQKGSEREVRAAYDGYVAYFGTYRVDEAQSKVIHEVQGSLMPSYTGTDQPRPFKLSGDELIIEGKTQEGGFYRRFRRVK
ncbi:lipocalin-like domain-containing protein [Lysobacter antibioticus]|uniref:Lipocalin-like domain protein n=1 Tax=Lysobacter antibioticus TaxID=84531 RepID=A0A0S2F5A6_LYSAN|nr:lipocalin-like domain-containing protein [Lysobacter antibioticus]ALN78726.1 lipocalin-like domain protein [Lysobacter antibioticus]